MITRDALIEAFEGMDEKTAETIVALIEGTTEVDTEGDDRFPRTSAWIRQCYNMPGDSDLIMSAIDELLGGFGVEVIKHPNEGEDFIAEYSNQGETYAATILRDMETGKYCLTSWGDWYEAWEQEQCEEGGLVSCGYCSHLTPIENDEWGTTVCESCGRCVSTGELPVEDKTDEDHAFKRLNRIHGIIERSLFYQNPPLEYRKVMRAIELAAKLIEEYEWDSERLWYIGESGSAAMSDLLTGAYWFFSEHYSGMWSDEYRTMCVIGQVFKPGCSSLEPDSPEADVYAALEDISGLKSE
jgi:hypothetical protein